MILSSLSPSHLNKEVQQTCLKSWEKYGDVFCLQTKLEIEPLNKLYPDVRFIPTARTSKHILKKELVLISEFINYAKEMQDDLLIINSDIFLSPYPTSFKQDGVTAIQRMDYKVNHSDGQPFLNGFDAFYVPYKFLDTFPQSLFAMGACWWDYWLPFKCITNSIPLYLKTGIAFHKTHQLQWEQSEWILYAELFRWENKLSIQNIGQMGSYVLDIIKNTMKNEN